MNIAITGASGFIGRRLLKVLGGAGHSLTVFSRHAGTNLPPSARLVVWDPAKGLPPREALEQIDAVVHLAGESVAQRWTPEAKRRIGESRVQGTRNLVQGLAAAGRRPAVLVCASAVGYYGSREDEVLTENSSPGRDFLAQVCMAWEKEATAAAELGIRVVCLRIGLVLAAHGGGLARMLPPFKAGVGGKLGSGVQWTSWIHLDDLAELARYAVEHPLDGPVNATAPNPVTNAEFTRTLARALHRPALFPVPAFALKILFGEMAEILLASQRAVPQAALGGGFAFRYPELAPALEQLLKPR